MKNSTAVTRSARKPVSLESWFWAFVFSLCGLLLILAKIGKSEQPDTEAFAEFNLARLNRFATEPTDRKVILLGDSQIKYAIGDEARLRVLAQERGADIVFLRIIQNAAQFSDFEALLDDVLAAKPDLILLQAPLYVRERSKDLNLRILQRYIVWTLRERRELWNPTGEDQEHLQTNLPCSRDFSAEILDERIRRFHARATYSQDSDNALAVREFRARAASKGTDIIALGAPMTQTLRDALADTPGYRLIHDQVLADGSAAWSYGDTISDSEFCDFIHLNEDGRERYADWLADKIVAHFSPATSAAGGAIELSPRRP